MSDETIEIIIDQDDVDTYREQGYLVKNGVLFRESVRADEITEEDFDVLGTAILSPSTLYRRGEAIWETAIDGYTVEAEYDRPSLERWLESELQHFDTLYEDAERALQREWIDGNTCSLNNVTGWVNDD